MGSVIREACTSETVAPAPGADRFRYSLAGLALTSTMSLGDGLGRPISVPDAYASGIVVESGQVPQELAIPQTCVGDIQISGDLAHIAIHGVGRCIVRGGNSITVQSAPSACMSDVRRRLIEPAIAVALHRRRAIPVKSLVAEVGGEIWTFLGLLSDERHDLALGLRENGDEVLSESGFVVCSSVSGVPLIYAGSSRIRTPMRLIFVHNLLPRSRAPEIEELSAFSGLIGLRKYVDQEGLIDALDNESLFLTLAGAMLAKVRCFNLMRPRTERPPGAEVGSLLRACIEGGH